MFLLKNFSFCFLFSHSTVMCMYIWTKLSKYNLRAREKKRKSVRKNVRFLFWFSFFFSILRITVYVCVCVCHCMSVFLEYVFFFFSGLFNVQSFLCCWFWLSRYFVTQVRLYIKSALLQHCGKVYYQFSLVFSCCFSMFVLVHLFQLKCMSCSEKKAYAWLFLWVTRTLRRTYQGYDKKSTEKNNILLLERYARGTASGRLCVAFVWSAWMHVYSVYSGWFEK